MGVNTFFTKGMMNTSAEHNIKMSFGLDHSQTIWLTVSHESMYKYTILIAHFLRLKMWSWYMRNHPNMFLQIISFFCNVVINECRHFWEICVIKHLTPTTRTYTLCGLFLFGEQVKKWLIFLQFARRRRGHY